MTTNPEEHDFIKQVCAEDDAARVPPRLSDDPAVRLAECREDFAAQISKCSDACDRGLPMLPVVFDEAAERVKFEALCESKGLEYDRYTEYAGEYAGQYTISRREHEWHGWFACAKSHAEVK